MFRRLFSLPEKSTPNCTICKWAKPGFGNATCIAQGGRSAILCHNTRLCKKLFEELEEKERVEDIFRQGIIKALEIASEFGQDDGAHHKAWVIDQMVRELLINTTGYNDFVKKYKDGEEGPDTYDWDEGIAP